MSRPLSVTIIVCLFSLCAVGLRSQEPARFIPPQSVYYYQPAASVFGSEAAWVNPAGLAKFSVTGFQLMADYYDGSYARSWGMLTQREHLVMAYRSLHNPEGADLKEYLVAVGVPLGDVLGIGACYRSYPEGPDDFRKAHTWELSLQGRGSGVFSWGAVFSNLNHVMVNDLKTRVEQRYSLAYRPMKNKLTLAVDMSLSTAMKMAHADYIYHAEICPVKGLYLNGYVDSHKNFQIGLRANLIHYFTGTKAGYNRSGNHHGTAAFLGWYDKTLPSIIREPSKKLSMDLGGSLPENPPRPVLGIRRQPFITQLLTVYRAADDPSVNAMLVKIRDGSFGFAKAQELREALSYFKSRGKRLFCFLSAPGNLTYYVASIADTIIIPPVSELELVGLRAEQTFYAGTLEKLGITIEMLHVGAYKSAAEAYSRKEPSEENRAQMNRLLDEWYDQFVAGLTVRHALTPDSVRNIIDHGPYVSAEALQHGLVDMLCYEDQIDSALSRSFKTSLAHYGNDTLINDDWRHKPVVAVVAAEGDITSDQGDVSPIGRVGEVTPGWMRKGFAAAVSDRRVKAVVFRINSPGGSALASDEILHTTTGLANRKPIVVSMGNAAASGGYYIAMSARRLFADPATVTGSVGIFGGKADFSGLHQKLALGKELYTRGRFAGMMTTIRPFTDEERAKYMGELTAFYGHFVDLVAGNRSLSRDSVDALGGGQVWTGREARRSGLVDEIGGLKQALDYAANSRGLHDYVVEVLPEKRPWFIWPSPSLAGLIGRIFGGGTNQEFEDAVGKAVRMVSEPILARMPYDIVVE